MLIWSNIDHSSFNSLNLQSFHFHPNTTTPNIPTQPPLNLLLDTSEASYPEDTFENPSSQDQYIQSSKYCLYVVRKNHQELCILYDTESSSDVEQISEVAHEFYACLSSLMKPDYVFSAQSHP